MEGKETKNTVAAAASSSPLFSFSNSNASFGFGFGFSASSGPPPPPPPPAVEVLLSEESPVAAGELEPVVIDDSLSIYKVRLQKCLHCVCGNASVAAARLCSATDSIRLLIVI
jgi:hypothetical protein